MSSEDELLAEQEAKRAEAAFRDLYARIVDFITDGDLVMSKCVEEYVVECRMPFVRSRLLRPFGLPQMMSDERLNRARGRFSDRYEYTEPGEYEVGCALLGAAMTMAYLDIDMRMAHLDINAYSHAAQEWLDYLHICCSAGFEPSEEDEWLMERVQASVKEEKDE